jgi:MYND finger
MFTIYYVSGDDIVHEHVCEENDSVLRPDVLSFPEKLRRIQKFYPQFGPVTVLYDDSGNVITRKHDISKSEFIVVGEPNLDLILAKRKHEMRGVTFFDPVYTDVNKDLIHELVPITKQTVKGLKDFMDEEEAVLEKIQNWARAENLDIDDPLLRDTFIAMRKVQYPNVVDLMRRNFTPLIETVDHDMNSEDEENDDIGGSRANTGRHFLSFLRTTKDRRVVMMGLAKLPHETKGGFLQQNYVMKLPSAWIHDTKYPREAFSNLSLVLYSITCYVMNEKLPGRVVGMNIKHAPDEEILKRSGFKFDGWPQPYLYYASDPSFLTFWRTACVNCAERVSTHLCGGCMTTTYCGNQCHRKHWDRGHKQSCKK